VPLPVGLSELDAGRSLVGLSGLGAVDAGRLCWLYIYRRIYNNIIKEIDLRFDFVCDVMIYYSDRNNFANYRKVMVVGLVVG
jgi:hypothetical protein